MCFLGAREPRICGRKETLRGMMFLPEAASEVGRQIIAGATDGGGAAPGQDTSFLLRDSRVRGGVGKRRNAVKVGIETNGKGGRRRRKNEKEEFNNPAGADAGFPAAEDEEEDVAGCFCRAQSIPSGGGGGRRSTLSEISPHRRRPSESSPFASRQGCAAAQWPAGCSFRDGWQCVTRVLGLLVPRLV